MPAGSLRSQQRPRGPAGQDARPRTNRSTPAARQSRPAPNGTAPLELPAHQLLQYERKGYLVTRRLLEPSMLTQLKADVQQHVEQHMLVALKQRVRVLCPHADPAGVTSTSQARRVLARRATQPVGFLQFFHLHRTCPMVKQLVNSPLLAGTAAQLMGVDRVRLYQDCIFLKEPGHADTNWHSDLRMAPFDANGFVTAWIPLRDIQGSEKDSGMLFAAGSHRDFALPFWHNLEGRDLSDRGYALESTGAMTVGDVSWHHGWTLHCAGPQPRDTPIRLALAVSFFADGSKLLATRTDTSVHTYMQHSEDAESYADWLQEMEDGAAAVHPKLPLVYVKPTR